MDMRTILGFLFAAFIFVSCEREVEFEGGLNTPLLVVNSFVTPDSVVMAYISRSRFFLEDSVEFRSISNAEVNLWVNGELKEKLTSFNNGVYKSSYKPAITDKIKIMVNATNVQKASASTIFPEMPLVLSVDTQRVLLRIQNLISDPSSDRIVGTRKYYKTNYTLKLSDIANQQNYYRLIAGCESFSGIWNYDTHKMDTINNLIRYDYLSFTDVVSGNAKDPLADSGTSPVGVLLSNSTNVYNVFSDEIFNGKTYSLKFSTNEVIDNYFNIESLKYSGENTLKNKVYISIQSISKDYYLYLKTRAASAATNYFSEPVKVHNNIVGGLGILGSYTSSNVVEFDLP